MQEPHSVSAGAPLEWQGRPTTIEGIPSWCPPRGRFKKGVLALVTEPGGITNRLGLAKPIYFLTTRGQHYVLAEFYKRLNKTTWRESQTKVFLASASQLWMQATCRREGQDLRVGIPKHFFE